MALANTTLGIVLGAAYTGFDQFLGVPFGEAKRFEAGLLRTTPYNQQPLKALKFGPACLQFLNESSVYGAEHGCLVANIWRPSGAGKDSALPVLIYVPGGENAFGEGSPYNASSLSVDQQTVVLSINYRVGPFGFLAFEEDVAAGRPTGHFALSDIQAALRWARREVSAFGGLAARLTLFGQSSGGGLVLMHAFLPSSRGLVEGLLSQSSGPGAVSMAVSLRNTHHIAQRLNWCSNSDPSRAGIDPSRASTPCLKTRCYPRLL